MSKVFSLCGGCKTGFQELKKNVFGNSNSAHSEALVAWGRDKECGLNSNRGNSRSKSKTRNNTCNYCRKEGHWKVNCLKLKDKYYSSSNFGASANVVNNAVKFVVWWMFGCTKFETRNLVFYVLLNLSATHRDLRICKNFFLWFEKKFLVAFMYSGVAKLLGLLVASSSIFIFGYWYGSVFW